MVHNNKVNKISHKTTKNGQKCTKTTKTLHIFYGESSCF